MLQNRRAPYILVLLTSIKSGSSGSDYGVCALLGGGYSSTGRCICNAVGKKLFMDLI